VNGLQLLNKRGWLLNLMYSAALFWIILVMVSFCGCNPGLTIANLVITPIQDDESVYTIIVDQDSTEHWYDKAIYTEENYCYKHHIWENVRKKNSE
jgi:hypothetical protein